MIVVNKSLERIQIPAGAWSLPLLCPLSQESKQRRDSDQEQKDVEALCLFDIFFQCISGCFLRTKIAFLFLLLRTTVCKQ